MNKVEQKRKAFKKHMEEVNIINEQYTFMVDEAHITRNESIDLSEQKYEEKIKEIDNE